MTQNLSGRRVLVTRTRERAAGLVDALHAEGAEAVIVPLLSTTLLSSPEAVADALDVAAARSGSWVAFTSATAARIVLGAVGADRLARLAVAAVGGETAAVLTAGGVFPTLVGTGSAAALAEQMSNVVEPGAEVWFPAAKGAGDELHKGLAGAGAFVRRLDLYTSDMPSDAPRRLQAALSRPLDAVTLTSGSSARHLVQALGEVRLPEGTVLACLGPPTAAVARDMGFTDLVVAAEPTVTSLVAVIVQRLAAAQPLR